MRIIASVNDHWCEGIISGLFNVIVIIIMLWEYKWNKKTN